MIPSHPLLLHTERPSTQPAGPQTITSVNQPRIRFARLALTAFVCAFCCGCVVPIHTAKKTRVATGQLTTNTTDLSFIKAGTTSRADVIERLGWMDTGIKDDRFFIGRWAESSWGVLWFGAVPYGAAGDWTRKWNAHNVLIDFDENGVVQQVSYFADKDTLATLSSLVSKYPSHTLDLSTPIEVPVEHFPGLNELYYGKLVLAAQSFAFVENAEGRGKGKYDMQTSPDNLRDLIIRTWYRADSKHPQQLCIAPR